MVDKVRTRILIVSDTHGHALAEDKVPIQRADVAIHCGDLTDGSKLTEFREAIAFLKRLNAPLKLVIPGNHDFILDGPALEAKVQEAEQELDPDLLSREYGSPEIIRSLFDDDARAQGILLLSEGTHTFDLHNGARLTVYASPYTPSLGAWGFQYHPDKGHPFDIQPGTDIVMTHGPPRGILDFTYGRERAGCPHLFAAVARAKPKLHCFGHIHEGWGAKFVAWKSSGTIDHPPTHFTAIDNETSMSIDKLADLRASTADPVDRRVDKAARLRQLAAQRCAVTSHGTEDDKPLEPGKHTIFVNASIESEEEFPQRPWLVDLDLPASTAAVEGKWTAQSPKRRIVTEGSVESF